MSSPPKRVKKIPNSHLDKIERKNLLEQQRRIKPGECLKYIRCLIDPQFLIEDTEPKITSALLDMNVKYEIKGQKIPRTIVWERSEQQFLLPSDDKHVLLSDKNQLEKFILLLILPEELIEAIKKKTLSKLIEDILLNFRDFDVTLLIYGLKNFCKANRSVIKRDEIEKSLTELQVLHGCSHRLHESCDELTQTVAQFTKAIAEIPYKNQKTEKYEDIGVFLENDNKNCVRVDGSAGLSRLWQQHLTRIPHVTLEIAEAIIREYPTPKTLLEAYEREKLNGSQLLENLKIRKNAVGHPLTSNRRIGPEISRKIYALYTSTNPDEMI